MSFKNFLFAACFAAVPAVSQGATVNLTAGSDWTEFRFDIGVDSGEWQAISSTPEIVSYTFTLAKSAYLQVTDAFRSGDVFEIFLNGGSIGKTSATSVVGNQIGADYDAAMLDAAYSSGSWLLSAGSYTLSGFVVEQPETRGRAALRLVEAATVPVPGTLVLMLSAGGALGAAGLRRRNRAAGGDRA